ncbi:hypothetical protein [Pseudomonas sp. UMC65]|uniref:hypothetical protein n=1 Tax=Pseudomonas sp. UMC65 TaxID=1862323 RepID=UPI0016040A73|nr:hypothetical protein [Pseudomonas sp. UMC65]
MIISLLKKIKIGFTFHRDEKIKELIIENHDLCKQLDDQRVRADTFKAQLLFRPDHLKG